MTRAAAALQHRAAGAGLAVVVLWGASFSIQKVAFSAMGPDGFLFGRSVLLAACAAGLLKWRGSRLWPSLEPREWAVLLFAALAGQGLHVGLMIHGIHRSTAFSSALIMACGPVITLVLLRLWRGVRMQPAQALGVAVALVGVLLFMSEKLVVADWRASGGDLLLLTATVLFSATTIAITPLVVRRGGAEVMCWSTLLATPPMLAATAYAAADAPYATMGPWIWGAFLWSVVLAAFVGWILWAWVNAVRGVARSAPLLYLVPPVAGAIAWALHGEAFGAWKLAGAALALGGVMLAQRPFLVRGSR